MSKVKLRIDKVKKFFTCSDLYNLYENDSGNINIINIVINKRRQIYRLILDFSFLPQIIAVTVLYMFIRGESAVLLDNFTAQMYLIVFLQIFTFSFLTVLKRYYWLRILPVLAYLELIAAGFISGYDKAWIRFFLLAFFGLLICSLNLFALYGWKNVELLGNDDIFGNMEGNADNG